MAIPSNKQEITAALETIRQRKSTLEKEIAEFVGKRIWAFTQETSVPVAGLYLSIYYHREIGDASPVAVTVGADVEPKI